MKISLQKRIQLSFFLSIALVATIGAISFYYIHQLNDEVQQIIKTDIAISLSGGKIKSTLSSLRRKERIYLLNPDTPNFHESMQKSIEEFRKTVEEGLELSMHEKTKEIHENILEWLKEYESVVQRTQLPFSPPVLAKLLDDKARNIGSAVTKIEHHHEENLTAHGLQAEKLSDSSSRNMIFIIVTTILAGLTIGFFAPSKVVIPFRKLAAAMKEVQTANFNISVSIGGNDEIAELGTEFNKMVEEVRVFDDMKIKKIAFEKRKLDALSNIMDAGVIVLSIEEEILYMNRTLYEILGITSERILHVSIDDSPLPNELKMLFHESIARKDRFEKRKWSFTIKKKGEMAIRHAVEVSFAPVRNHAGDIVNFVVTMKEPSQTTPEEVTDFGDTW